MAVVNRSSNTLGSLLGLITQPLMRQIGEDIQPQLDIRADMFDSARRQLISTIKAWPTVITWAVPWIVPAGRVWTPLGGAFTLQGDTGSYWKGVVAVLGPGAAVSNFQYLTWVSEVHEFKFNTGVGGPSEFHVPIPYLPHITMREGWGFGIFTGDTDSTLLAGFAHISIADLPGAPGT